MMMLIIVKSFFSYSVPLPSDDNVEGNCGVVLTGMTLLSPSPPQKKLERNHRFRHLRRNNLWEEYLVMSRHTGEFTATYHMTESSFNKLVDQLSPHLQVDEAKSRNCTCGIQPIDKRIIVAAGLGWLGGEPYKRLANIFYFSRSSARRVVARFMDAVIATNSTAVSGVLSVR
jgi:hypothetical protein